MTALRTHIWDSLLSLELSLRTDDVWPLLKALDLIPGLNPLTTDGLQQLLPCSGTQIRRVMGMLEDLGVVSPHIREDMPRKLLLPAEEIADLRVVLGLRGGLA